MLKYRALPAALLAALACAAGPATAHAASAADERPGAIGAAGMAPDVHGVSIPATDLRLLSRAAHSRHSNGRLSQGMLESTNWAGYAATGRTFTSVSSNWTEPSVTCTSKGIVGFWVGLDGLNSSTVEQTGTGVDCTNGTPQQFAWWETYPANSVQVYNVPVSAGDQMSSSVVAQARGVYSLVLTDSTAGWTVENPVSLPAGTDASAEIIAEAVSAGNQITTLPDFGQVDFTGSTIDNTSLQAAGAQPIDMTDAHNNLIAATTEADLEGDFDVDYTSDALTP
jgi:hypothetical protein